MTPVLSALGNWNLPNLELALSGHGPQQVPLIDVLLAECAVMRFRLAAPAFLIFRRAALRAFALAVHPLPLWTKVPEHAGKFPSAEASRCCHVESDSPASTIMMGN